MTAQLPASYCFNNTLTCYLIKAMGKLLGDELGEVIIAEDDAKQVQHRSGSRTAGWGQSPSRSPARSPVRSSSSSPSQGRGGQARVGGGGRASPASVLLTHANLRARDARSERTWEEKEEEERMHLG